MTDLLFSIIIPTYNRAASLEQCLRSLEDLNFPPEAFEVIVVDDGSRHSVRAQVEGRSSPLAVRVLSRQQGGPAAARNAGAGVARGRYLAFTDDDCVVTSDWLSDYQGCFREHSSTGFGGRVLNADERCPYCHASQLIVDTVHQHFSSTPGSMFFIPTNNLAVPRHDFMELGGFNPGFRTSEDREFCRRWLASGRELRQTEKAVVLHDPKLDFRTFLKKHFSYGRGAFRFHRSGQGGPRKQDTWREALTFYARVFAQPLKRSAREPGQLRILGLLVLWQVANLAGFVAEMTVHTHRRKKRSPASEKQTPRD